MDVLIACRAYMTIPENKQIIPLSPSRVWDSESISDILRDSPVIIARSVIIGRERTKRYKLTPRGVCWEPILFIVLFSITLNKLTINVLNRASKKPCHSDVYKVPDAITAPDMINNRPIIRFGLIIVPLKANSITDAQMGRV